MQVILKLKCVNKNIGTTIDNNFINSVTKIKFKTEIIKSHVLDYFPIFFVVDCNIL